MNYCAGQQITTTYTNAPVSDDSKYQIGQEVDVSENGILIASFIVDKTDNTVVHGTINKVAGEVAR